jgi:hypothetical protein
MITPEEFKKEVITWANKIGVNPKEVHVREMRRKWASCSTSGRLTFSTSLLKEERGKRDEVVVHELLHLRYPNHGKMFQVLLNAYLLNRSKGLKML